MKRHYHVNNSRERVLYKVRHGQRGSGDYNYSYGTQFTPDERYAEAFGDLANFAGDGNLKNAVVSFLGSYQLHIQVSSLNKAKREVTLDFHIFNSTTLESGVRNPGSGYGRGHGNKKPPLRSGVYGPMSETTQDIYWSETYGY